MWISQNSSIPLSVILPFSTVGRSGPTDEGRPLVNADRSDSAVIGGNGAANDLFLGSAVTVSKVQKYLRIRNDREVNGRPRTFANVLDVTVPNSAPLKKLCRRN